MPRSLTLALAVLLALGLTGPVAATGGIAYPAPGVSVTSDNVTHVGYLAEAGPSVSGRLVELEDEKRFYVSSIARGLSIYNVDDPASPMLMGTLPIAGFQNEDMAVSADGDIAIVAYDTSGANWFIDTSDPALPRVGSVLRPGDHTIECVVADCSVAYGSSGRIFDLSDIDDVQVVTPGWRDVVAAQGVTSSQSAHAVHRDPETGYLLTDTSPRLILDVSEDPLNPVVVAGVEVPNRDNLRYQHNSLLPRMADYTPRADGDNGDGLRPGELLLATGETNAAPQCGATNGPFFTMDVGGWEESGGEVLTNRVLDVYRPPANSNYIDGNPAVNALGCSAHWFNWTHDQGVDGDYMVALGAFEHGARFLHVDAANGKITESGWFQPFNGSASGAYWIDDEHLYVVDYVRGVDILRFDHDPDLRPDDDAVARSWLASAQRQPLEITRAEQLSCRLASEL